MVPNVESRSSNTLLGDVRKLAVPSLWRTRRYALTQRSASDTLDVSSVHADM